MSENPRFPFSFDPDDQVFVLTAERPEDGKRSIQAFNELIQKSARGSDRDKRAIALRFQELRKRKQLGLIVHSPSEVDDVVGAITYMEDLGGVYMAVALRPEYHLDLEGSLTAKTRADTFKVLTKVLENVDFLKKDGRDLLSHEDFQAFLITEHVNALADAARLN